VPFDIRPITTDEIDDWSTLVGLGFQHHAEEPDYEFRRKYLNVDRTVAALDGSQMIGTAYSFPTPITTPGGATVTAAAVTSVVVLPTHTRRGALTAMMRAQLDDVVARGEPVAVLIAAEAPIYGRFGYGAATQHATVALDVQQARLAEAPEPRALRFVDKEELRGVAPAIHDRCRANRPGEIGRPDTMWDVQLGIVERSWHKDIKQRFHVVCDGDAGPEGYLIYKVKDDWDGRFPDVTVQVIEMAAATPAAYAALWQHVLRLDWVRRVTAEDRPVDEPLRFLLTDPRQLRVTMVADFLWTRLLDVPAALAARTYPVADRLVLDVRDESRPASGGRFALEGGPDGASCAPTREPADLVVGADDLAAAWLGGAPLWLPAAAGRVDEPTPGARGRFDTMFVTQPPPFCGTWF
jgi:predicted acetyltransferase